MWNHPNKCLSERPGESREGIIKLLRRCQKEQNGQFQTNSHFIKSEKRTFANITNNQTCATVSCPLPCPKLRALIIRNFEKRHYCQTTCATSHWTDTQCPLAQLHLPVVPLLFHSFSFQILYPIPYILSLQVPHTQCVNDCYKNRNLGSSYFSVV